MLDNVNGADVAASQPKGHSLSKIVYGISESQRFHKNSRISRDFIDFTRFHQISWISLDFTGFQRLILCWSRTIYTTAHSVHKSLYLCGARSISGILRQLQVIDHLWFLSQVVKQGYFRFQNFTLISASAYEISVQLVTPRSQRNPDRSI